MLWLLFVRIFIINDEISGKFIMVVGGNEEERFDMVVWLGFYFLDEGKRKVGFFL